MASSPCGWLMVWGCSAAGFSFTSTILSICNGKCPTCRWLSHSRLGVVQCQIKGGSYQICLVIAPIFHERHIYPWALSFSMGPRCFGGGCSLTQIWWVWPTSFLTRCGVQGLDAPFMGGIDQLAWILHKMDIAQYWCGRSFWIIPSCWSWDWSNR